MTHESGRPLPAPSPAAHSRKSQRRWISAAIAAPVLLWGALYAGAAQPLRGSLAKQASAALGRDVTIGGPLRILVTPLSIYLTAGDVRVANPRWAMADDMLIARQVSVQLAMFDLLIGRTGIRALDVRGGTLDLERSRVAGRVNWSLGQPGTLFDPAALHRIDADDLAVRYRDFGADKDMQLAVSTNGAGRISFAGRGEAGAQSLTLDGEARSAVQQPTLFAVNLRTDGQDIALQGEAALPLQFGRARITATARGGDFAQLAALAGITLPAMPGYALQAQLRHAPQGWHFSRIEGRIGRTDLAGKLTLDQRHARPRVVAQLTSATLDAADGMALLGLHRDAAPIDLSDAGLPLSQRLLPDAAISTARLRSFDAVLTYAADRMTGTPHDPTHLSLKLALVNGVMTLSPVSVDLAGGFISSDITLDARQSTTLARYDIRLSPTPMGRLLRQWGVAESGTDATARGRIQLTGRGETLRETFATASGRIALVIPQGTVRTRRASYSGLDIANLNAALFDAPPFGASQVNCGLIAFTVRDGLATADPILIDTQGHALAGHGRIDLRDETVDLHLSADGKRFAFRSQPGRVHVSGTLADPLVMREPSPWFRPSRFLGFGMMLPDFGSIFSFVDPGDARDTACAPLLHGQTADAPDERPQELASLP